MCVTEKLISMECDIQAMTNKHIKIINGRKYYYQSIRRGKKVTSKYLGPVDKRIKRKRLEGIKQEDLVLPDDSYIG